MGMTGANGFPCCSKDSVDIVETQIDLNQHELPPTQEESQPSQEESQPAQEELPPAQEESQPAQEESQPAQEESQPAQEESQPAQEESQPAQEESQPAQEELPPAQEELPPAQEEPQPAQEEDEEEEDESLHLNVPPKEDPEQDTKLVQEANTPPPLEEYCPAPMLKPEAKKDSSLKVCNEDLESSQPLEGALTQPDTQQWNVRSSSITSPSPSIMDVEQVDSTHRSIFVQTSKHLFWADKDIQASEHSLDLETGLQRGKSTEKIASPLNQKAAPEPVPVKQFQDASTQAELSEPGTGQPSDTHLPSPCLTPAINLQDLVNFASSLAIASSSNRDLPSLEHIMKSPPRKAVEPSPVPTVESATPPAKGEPEQEKLPELQERASEKSLEAGEPLESAKQEDKTLHPYFDFSKPEPQRTAFKGKVKFIQ
ncbi:PREDICTED: spermatogenesis-associated protein 32 [Myotis davidii]|uniref:spermatogenesis-associated protein 32 n=1 Tax=Myotis davidii TaxID=225400 RepID=UPI0003EBD66C|nr:PREDICTED: spermatogenesis-associated protein 32 [Myotis davidii]